MSRKREQPVLDEVKNALLKRFQQTTGEEDSEKGIMTLEAEQWDLEKAVERYLEGREAQLASSAPRSLTWYGWATSFLGNIFSTFSGGDGPTDPSRACTKFLLDFEAEHGSIHPSFIEGSYNDALAAAKNSYKFLVVYLHSNVHENTHSFCRDTLCTELITEFLNEHFVCWAGSISMSEAYRISNLWNVTSYPFLAVVCNNVVGGITILERIEGIITAEDLITQLTNVLETHAPMLVAAKLENEEREMDRRIRQEQDEAFMQSLAADQEKERRLKEEEERKREEERNQQRLLELKSLEEKERENARKLAGTRVPTEPDPSEKDVTLLIIRLTDGSRLQRRFRHTDSLKGVFDYVTSSHSLNQEFDLVTNFPRRTYTEEGSSSLSLQEAGLCPQASLFVQER